MPIKVFSVTGGIGVPSVQAYPCDASNSLPAGCLVGLDTGGQLRLLSSGGTALAANGILGIPVDDTYTNASSVPVAPSLPTGVAASVYPTLGVPNMSSVLSSVAIAGTDTPQAMIIEATDDVLFVQRGKKGIRWNQSLVGKVCDLVWNSTTSEYEPDTGTTSLNCIVIRDVPRWYGDNRTYYDSANYATDAVGAYVVFSVVDSFQQIRGLTRYT